MSAGPPPVWLVTAGAIGVVVVAGLYFVGVRDRSVLIALPLVALVIACLADRGGWRIRMATAELADLQRKRWSFRRLPADPLSAEAWLRANPEAPALYRAGVLVTAGRPRDALALIDGTVAETPEEAVRIARIRLMIDAGLGEAALDRHAIQAFERMPELGLVSEAERRYHRLSLAWSEAWLQINANRPWREAFASSLRDLAPFKPPIAYTALHATQQLALPIAYSLTWLIFAWLGLLDWLP